VKNIHFAKGTLLDYDEVYLSEGGWPQMAYRDAAERERLRGKRRPLNYASARAPRVSYGPYEQQLDRVPLPNSTPAAEPTPVDAEVDAEVKAAIQFKTEAHPWTPNVSAEPIPTSLPTEEPVDAMQALSVSLGGETTIVVPSTHEDEALLQRLPQTLPQKSTYER
jgi:hypothetical protein